MKILLEPKFHTNHSYIYIFFHMNEKYYTQYSEKEIFCLAIASEWFPYLEMTTSPSS